MLNTADEASGPIENDHLPAGLLAGEANE